MDYIQISWASERHGSASAKVQARGYICLSSGRIFNSSLDSESVMNLVN